MKAEDPEEKIDYELIKKTNLANIIGKAAAGQPLTARELTLVEEAQRKEEQEKEDVVAGGGSKSGGLFSESETRLQRKGKNTGYKYAYVVYAELYLTSNRTIERWVKLGKEKGSLPPLENPHGMKKWWTIQKNQIIPEGIMSACVKAGWEEGEKTAGSPEILELPVQRVDKKYKTEDSDALERLRKAEASAGARLMDLLEHEKPDFPEIQTAQRAFDNAASLRAKYEPVYIKRMKENKELFTYEALLRSAQDLHIPIIEGLRGLKESFFYEIGEKYEEEMKKYWDENVEKGFIQSLHDHYVNLASDE